MNYWGLDLFVFCIHSLLRLAGKPLPCYNIWTSRSHYETEVPLGRSVLAINPPFLPVQTGTQIVECITRFYIGEYQHIRLSVDRRYNTFNIAACLLAGGTYIQRAVNNYISELSGFGKFHDIYIIQWVGKLGAYFSVQWIKAIRGCSIPKWRHVHIAYQIISIRCCKVGRGITAASEKKSNLWYVGISITARCVRIFPFGSNPFSLSSIACNRLSVLIIPFIRISAPPSRTMRTASRAASSESSIWMIFMYSGYCLSVGYFPE